MRRRVRRPTTSPPPPLTWETQQPTLLGLDDGLLRAQWSNLFIMRWYGPSTVERLEVAFRDIRAVADQYGSVAMLSILEPGTTPPDEEARAMVAKYEHRLGRRLTAIAYLPYSQGFLTSTLMSLLVGLKQVRRNRTHQEKVFKSSQVASSWLESFVDRDVEAQDLALTIQLTQALSKS